ncbi:MAG TPA: hypothetical protein VF974_02930 [Patescibacteria group bacterium]
MVLIIFVLIGVGLMFVPSVSLSAKSELRRPKTIIYGIILIVAAAVTRFLSSTIDIRGGYPVSWLLSYAIPIILGIGSVIFLKQPKMIDPTAVPGMQPAKSSTDNIANVLTWIILGVIGLGALYLVYKMFINH